MKAKHVQVGSTITNGSSALRIVRREEKDPHWQCAGWRGQNISLERFGGNTGSLGFVPDYLLGSWEHVAFEWAPLIGGGLEHRYVWAGDYSHLQHEVRKVELEVGDPVRVKAFDEQGVVKRVEESGVWVETECNMFRNWSRDAFVKLYVRAEGTLEVAL